MPDGQNPVRGAPIGRFSWNTHTDVWQWSDGAYVLHGYPAGAVRPTRALVLAHKHADDRSRADGLFRRISAGPQSFSIYHRLIDLAGRERTVLSVGATAHNPDGHLVSSGYLVDLTEDERRANTAAIQAAVRHREVINQAQGAVMACYALTPEAALQVLIWHSRTYNIKLNLLARRVVTALAARAGSADLLHPGMDALLFAEATRSRSPEELSPFRSPQPVEGRRLG